MCALQLIHILNIMFHWNACINNVDIIKSFHDFLNITPIVVTLSIVKSNHHMISTGLAQESEFFFTSSYISTSKHYQKGFTICNDEYFYYIYLTSNMLKWMPTHCFDCTTNTSILFELLTAIESIFSRKYINFKI